MRKVSALPGWAERSELRACPVQPAAQAPGMAESKRSGVGRSGGRGARLTGGRALPALPLAGEGVNNNTGVGEGLLTRRVQRRSKRARAMRVKASTKAAPCARCTLRLPTARPSRRRVKSRRRLEPAFDWLPSFASSTSPSNSTPCAEPRGGADGLYTGRMLDVRPLIWPPPKPRGRAGGGERHAAIEAARTRARALHFRARIARKS